MANVYAIGFPSGKLYVGLTSKTVSQRLTAHLKDTRAGSKLPVHNALRKYGRNVQLVVLAQGVSFDEAKDLEIWWISQLNTFCPGGYNLTRGGEGMVGYKFTAETKKKISEAKRGGKLSTEHRAKISGGQRGKKHTEETKAKMSEANKARKPTAETRAKMSEASKGHQRRLGKKHTAAAKAKMSKAQRGKKHTAVAKVNMSNAQRQRWLREKNANS